MEQSVMQMRKEAAAKIYEYWVKKRLSMAKRNNKVTEYAPIGLKSLQYNMAR
jgi:hypothetical protein